MNLSEIRSEIDAIDGELVKLFVRRMEASEKVAAAKRGSATPVQDPAREREILARVSELAGNDLAGYSRILFSNLFELSRSYQAQRINHRTELADKIENALEVTPKLFPKEAIVACQGVEGANSQIACDKIFQFANIFFHFQEHCVFRDFIGF